MNTKRQPTRDGGNHAEYVVVQPVDGATILGKTYYRLDEHSNWLTISRSFGEHLVASGKAMLVPAALLDSVKIIYPK